MGNNFPHFKMVHLSEMQDCVEGHCQNSVPYLRTHHLHHQVLQKIKAPFEFDWKVVVMGYGCGFIVDTFVGQIIIKRKSD